MRYFPALTGVRGVASLWVFLFHAFMNYSFPLIENGHLGVDLFFVLSGFIISHIHATDFQHGISWLRFKQFMALRVSRIYPLHLLTLLCLLAIVILIPQFLERYKAAPFSAFNFAGNIFLVHTWLTPFIPFEMRGPGWSWNAPAWSLSAEWLMYFLFPAIAFGLGRLRKTSSLLMLGLCCLAIYAILEVLGIGLAGLPRAGMEFVAGCTLHFALSHRHEQWQHWNIVAGIATIAILLASTVNGLMILAPVAFYALIPAIAFSEGWVTRLLSCRASLWLGEISLALYLIHWPILQLQQLLLPMNWLNSGVMAVAYSAFLAGIVMASFLVYRYFELPMRNICRNWLRARIDK